MNDFSGYRQTLKICQILSYLDVILSLPIYLYAIFYMLYRAQKHIKNIYRFILLSKIFWNFSFEQLTSGLATIWFAPIQVACPTGYLAWFQLPPVIWQVALSCLGHALPVSIAHLFFYRLKSAVWPSFWYKILDQFGTPFFYALYPAGFFLWTREILNSGGPADRLIYAQNFTGFPDVFWSDLCYISSLKNAEGSSHNLPLLVVFGITNLLIYLMPVVTFIVIYMKFKSNLTRNAILQRNLFKSLLIHTFISFLMYTIPSNINQSLFFLAWFNPGLVAICQVLVQTHGSFIVFSIFWTNSGFWRDLLEDLRWNRFRINAVSNQRVLSITNL